MRHLFKEGLGGDLSRRIAGSIMLVEDRRKLVLYMVVVATELLVEETNLLADEVQANFPDGIALPMCLRMLCDYLDENGYPLSGCFEICDWGRKDAEGWFPNDLATQQKVAIFGRGSTGSSYALWLVADPNPNEAPVVLFGSEGEFIVLASNAVEFCRLLGLGYTEVECDDLSNPPAEWSETAPLRSWLADKLHLDFPAIGQEIARKAQKKHRGFGAWMRNWQKENL